MDCSQEPLLGEHSSQENMQWQTEANIESQADSGAQPDELNEEDEDAVMTYYKSLGLGGAEAEQELGGSRSQRKMQCEADSDTEEDEDSSSETEEEEDQDAIAAYYKSLGLSGAGAATAHQDHQGLKVGREGVEEYLDDKDKNKNTKDRPYQCTSSIYSRKRFPKNQHS